MKATDPPDEIRKQAAKAAGQRIGAHAGAKAPDILGRMFVNWACENPEKAEAIFNRIMSAVYKIMEKVDL